ncbi:MAG: beta-L-arabinofuranosidase domain-containing protein, partial [Terriglobia bacterium]
FRRIHAAYLALDNDRLLKVYRQRAGLPAPGLDMGGWYDAEGFVPGHSLGQYISGLSRFASATQDPAAYAKVKQLVEGFAATLGPGGYPYASAKASTTWPCYILDKFEIGLLDAYRFGRVPSARALLARVIRGAIPYLPPKVHDRGPDSPKQAPYDEPYILPENLYNAFEVTGGKEFLSMAQKYLLNKDYFEPLAQDANVLPGKHAYSHVMALSSAAKAYAVTGEAEYLESIRNAWDMLARTQEYASGGWGPNETFVEPAQGRLGESLTSTHSHFETPCGCYAHFKLARYLLRFTAEPAYGDGLERLLYNAILGAKDPSGDGHFFYYSDYHSGARKSYYPHKWPCCSGTLVQDVADYLVGIYFQSRDGIYVNLFVPSEVRATLDGTPVRIIQTTRYPEDGDTELRLETPSPATFTVCLRIPAWLEGQPKLSVNGKHHGLPAERGTFAAVRRRWRNNDTIQLALPLNLRTESIDERHPKTVAVMWGPVMLVALADVPMAGPLSLPEGLRRAAYKPLTFETADRAPKLQFAPFYSVGDETYTNYVLKS